MKIRLCVTVLGLAACVAPAAARETTPSLPAVKAEAVHYVVDCQHRRPPAQREVGEWTGQRNFGQVYDSRRRLMAEVARACRRDGIRQVQLVSRDADAPGGSPLLAAVGRDP